MPRQETPLDPDGGPVVQFAIKLREQRARAGVTYRAMQDAADLSHTHLRRIASGEKLPSWKLTKAFLAGCGVTSTASLRAWRQAWATTARQINMSVSDGPNVRLIKARNRQEFGDALRRIAQRSQPGQYAVKPGRTPPPPRRRTLRDLAKQTGYSKTALSEWLSGRRLPSSTTLFNLAVLLGATKQEQIELARIRNWLENQPVPERVDYADTLLTLVRTIADEATTGEDHDGLRRLSVALLDTTGRQDDLAFLRSYELWAAAHGPVQTAKHRAPLSPEQLELERAEAARLIRLMDQEAARVPVYRVPPQQDSIRLGQTWADHKGA